MKKLGFGCMRLPVLSDGNVDIEAFKQMVDYYLAHGFTYFDTSYVYHGGKSESAVREALTSRYPRESYVLATKMPTWSVSRREEVRKYCLEQLERTGAGYFDNYLMHMLTEKDYERMVDIGAFDEFRKLKEEGKIRHICCSFHDTADVLGRILDEQKDIEAVQIIVNFADMEDPDLTIRDAYETIVAHGKNVIVMEPVKGGELVVLPPALEAQLRAREPRASVPSWAIRYAATLPGVMVVLSGMSNLDQVKDNTAAMEEFVPLNAQEMQMMRGLGKHFFEHPPIDYHQAKIVNPKVKTFLALMNNRLLFPIPHGWQDAMYGSYSGRVGKPAELIENETDPVVIDGLKQAIASYETH